MASVPMGTQKEPEAGEGEPHNRLQLRQSSLLQVLAGTQTAPQTGTRT